MPGTIIFHNGVPLFSSGQLAMDPACCCSTCNGTCFELVYVSWYINDTSRGLTSSGTNVPVTLQSQNASNCTYRMGTYGDPLPTVLTISKVGPGSTLSFALSAGSLYSNGSLPLVNCPQLYDSGVKDLTFDFVWGWGRVTSFPQ